MGASSGYFCLRDGRRVNAEVSWISKEKKERERAGQRNYLKTDASTGGSSTLLSCGIRTNLLSESITIL